MEAKIRILHIDDNIHDRQLVKDVLQKEHDGFEIVEADNRKTFEQYLAEDNFDLVLSDFNILGFDGLQVLQVVKDKNPDLPVIIVTGTGSEEIAIQAMKMGAADYVIKSVKHIMGLVPTIKTVLEFKKTQEDHKLALMALRESEELFRTAFESAAIGVCLISLEGKFISVNNTLCNILGYSREELEQLTYNSITHDEDENISNSAYARLLTGEINSIIFEKRYIHKLGHSVWVNISTGIVRNARNESHYFVSYIQDITERKKSEEQLLIAKEKAEESDRLKSAFLHNISHEIRTPMNAIVGFSELLKTSDLHAEKNEEYTEIIIQSSNQLLSIITDIISIATIEAGQGNIQEKDINLNSTFNFIYKQFASKAARQNIFLSYKTTLPNNEAYITTDGTKLIEIFSNLISNALKFTDEGFVKWGYSVKETYLEFYVEDSGIGIPAEMHEEIFKRFRQLEATVNHQFSGSGLGLSISKAYVELLGGRIWVDSELGKGSVFYFTIPYKRANGQTLTEKQPIGKMIIEVKRPKNILIAEDEDNNFKLLEELLSVANFNLIRVRNGIEAVEICKTNPSIDLVLMDIKMPLLNGYEATRQIKKQRPNLPVIAQTAYSTDIDKNKAISCGCCDFISKPFKTEQLIFKIQEYLIK